MNGVYFFVANSITLIFYDAISSSYIHLISHSVGMDFDHFSFYSASDLNRLTFGWFTIHTIAAISYIFVPHPKTAGKNELLPLVLDCTILVVFMKWLYDLIRQRRESFFFGIILEAYLCNVHHNFNWLMAILLLQPIIVARLSSVKKSDCRWWVGKVFSLFSHTSVQRESVWTFESSWHSHQSTHQKTKSTTENDDKWNWQLSD